ncbi:MULTISPECIES: 3-hydroxyanthranilate 3,4-dioxygenase [unclassified Corallococcus]|uniref:3-hydroxyanthranilate 3,4-dioxygenase n=1 Tax=Corallococcus TaxID=83461 RepID=UPI001CC1A3F3|nr:MULTISPECIES: 3-hydroxyanthranilate 3,4-dioxygenase [unclassified Corallococcus]MBZ4335520.1 3-hydroxyanthranilate 3,4-dioxygenase [Corallococcus sp. AS-1-12]MBZ4372862.1 3-hydroxyanthranilate 3,4-dioxygenase [Corallococcus sp. AS-1-6]
MGRLTPINFKKWIDEHRPLLKPPVGNQQVWADRDFMVTVVGGPNSRTDFHVNEGEEFFYQLEGDITLRVIDEGQVRDIPIREGEIFLLPPKVPHSPQRPPNTIGLVLERRRQPQELDSFLWLCPKCGEKLYEESLHVTNLVTQLPPVFEHFYGNPEHCTCKQCGTKVTRGGAPQ